MLASTAGTGGIKSHLARAPKTAGLSLRLQALDECPVLPTHLTSGSQPTGANQPFAQPKKKTLKIPAVITGD